MNSTFPIVRPLDPQISQWIRNVKNVTTFLSIFAGLSTIVVIIKGTNRSNSEYSRLQLIVITLSLLNDFIVQLIFSPHFLLPLPCLTRLDPLIPIPGNVIVHYIVWIVVVAEQAPAYVACFVHRHQAVLPPTTTWRLGATVKKFIFFVYSILALAPTPLLWKAIMPHNQAIATYTRVLIVFNFTRFLSPDWPCDLFDRTECSSFESLQPFTTTTLILHTTTVIIVVILITHTFNQLKKSFTISDRRRIYQQTMMRILILQSLFPILVQVLPNVAGLTVFVFGWSGSAVYPVILLILSTNSLALSIVLLGTTPLYRQMITKAIFGDPPIKESRITSLNLSSEFVRPA